MGYKFVRLLERPLVEQQIDALPSRELARGTLARTPLRAAALLGNGVTSSKFCELSDSFGCKFPARCQVP